MPNPNHMVKPMATKQLASAPRSVNVDIDTVREVKTAKPIGPLVKGTLGVLIVCGLAATIVVPIGLTQRATADRAIAETATPTTITTTSLSTLTSTSTTSTSTSTTSTTTTSTTSTSTSSTTSTSTSSTTSTSTSSTTSTTTTTTTTSTTTTARPIVAITRTGDPIIGVYNTTAGGSIGGVNASYSGPSEYPPYAIDNSTSTKYLNFGVNTGGITVYQPGINTGFYVSPVSSTASIAFGLLFATANDVPDRDPITVTLEGTNTTSLAALYLGSSWTLIYSGPTGISGTTDPGRQVYVSQQNFSNTLAFRSYRLLVTSQRGNVSSVQYSEAQIIGYL
ncbi:unnamed protein product [Rotaria sordida]|uniref:Uncharacterized protein n=1 Tax=Rotaria sordida TaxID=392033 RepID=A0A815QS78_9BILA|nr:unnamed protein product [Rotaria sordida]